MRLFICMNDVASSMPSCMFYAVGVPGVHYPMTFPLGRPSTTIFVDGDAKVSGIVCSPPCACKSGGSKVATLSPAPRSLTVSRSKPAPFAAQRRVMIWEKKTWGRKRHALVDSQGHLLAIKVLAASSSDQEGARSLLLPVKDTF